MEVRSDPGTFPFRESFSPGVPTSPARDPPAIQSMRLPYTRDGTSPSPTPLVAAAPFQGGGGGGGSAASTATERPSGNAPLHGLNINIEEPVKRKRGRPRKHGSDGTMALAWSPTFAAGSTTLGRFSPSTNSASDPTKKAKGQPPGTGKKQQMAALGSAGIGFTPHVIAVNAGEDVSSKIMSFSQHGLRSVCILSANGVISNVTLRQAATSGGTATYEGRFEILSLSGSFLLSESSGHRSRTGGLSVCLASPDGLLLGGGVAGVLTAASPVQVVVGSFVVDRKKEPKQISPLGVPTSTLTKLTPIRPISATGANSPSSRGTLSESSGSGSRSPLIHNTGALDDNHQGLSNLLWK